jgi:glutathione S-transferase
MANEKKIPKVISFSPSADCELGRWVLLYQGIDYVEKRHAPPFFFLINKLYGGKSFILFIDKGLKLNTVRAIIDHFDSLAEPERKLIPDEFSQAIETCWPSFNAELGEAVVTWAYTNLLPHKEIMVRPLSLGSPWIECFFVKHFYNLPKKLMWKSLKLNKAAADEALLVIQKKFLEVDQMLSDGRKFLMGDRMTLADLAFAVSGAPLVLPAGYGGYQYEQGPIPMFEEFPKELQEIISDMRHTAAGKFILRLYAEERYRGSPSL